MRKLSNWFQKVSSGWVTLVALVIFVLFAALVLPKQASTAESNTGDEWTPDLSFYYTGDELYQLAHSYGEDGRAAYIHARFTFDLIWPLVYLLFLTTGISWLFRKAFAPGNALLLLNLAPLIGTIFDYLENIATSIVMARYPTPSAAAGSIAPIFTMLKWVFVGGSCLLLLVGIGFWVWKLIRKRGG